MQHHNDVIKVRVRTRTKRAGQYLDEGSIVEIPRAEALKAPTIYQPMDEYKSTMDAQKADSEQARKEGEAALRERRAGIRESFRLQQEAAALVADNDAKRTQSLADAARNRLRSPDDKQQPQTQRGRKDQT